MPADPHTDPRPERRIVTFGPPPPEAETATLRSDPPAVADTADESPPWLADGLGEPASASRALPVTAILVAFAWTVFFLLSQAATLRGGPGLPAIAGLVAAWAVPVVLILAIYALIALGGRPMAARFARNAAALRGESEALETRLRAVNRELGAARAFLGSQAREIEGLGQRASERLTRDADRLAGLVQDNSAQIYAIEAVSATALGNMERLQADLFPVAAAARDAASQIGNAGRVATDQIDVLEAGVARLDDAAAAHAQTIAGLADRIDAALAAGEARAGALHRVGEERFAVLQDGLDKFGQAFDAREGEALAALRLRAAALQDELARNRELIGADEGAAIDALASRLAGLRAQTGDLAAEQENLAERASADWSARVEDVRTGLATLDAGAQARIAALRDGSAALDRELRDRADGFTADLDARRDRAEAEARDAIERLAARLETLDGAVADRQAAQIGQTREFIELSQAVLTHLHDLGRSADEAADTGEAAGRRLSTALGSLRGELDDSRERIGQAGAALDQATDAGVRLLEIVQAGTREVRDDLGTSIGTAAQRLETIETRSRAITVVLDQAGDKGAAIAEQVHAAGNASAAAMDAMDAFHARAETEQDRRLAAIGALRARLEEVGAQTDRLGDRARDDLSAAVETLHAARRDALAALADDTAGQVRAVADRIGDESAAAVERAVRERSTQALDALDSAAGRALEASRESTRQLRDQLALVNELAGNLEQRVARAREQAEEQVDNDFARRVAVITESLNSRGIDIAAALSNEIGDTEWAAYLRGDRGIFTRRAVRLLEQGEARETADLYRADEEFRAHVGRYIHDFEAMLRTLLSTRDGNALGVTLLSSDMGKLYVALAQSIERLRD